MIIRTSSFRTPNGQKENFSINQFTKLTGEEATAIRKAIADCLQADYETVCVDAKDVIDVDLSGINEIIHTNYKLQNTNLKLVFVYRQKSVVEKWVETTGLDKFISTAILPSV